MQKQTIIITLVAMVVLTASLFGGAWYVLNNLAEASNTRAAARLRDYVNSDRKYRIMIGVPVEKPSHWVEITGADGDRLIADNGENYALSSVRSFVVAYPDGTITDYAELFEMPGKGIHFVGRAKVMKEHKLSPAELERGNKLIQVTHGPSRFCTKDKPFYYTTTVKNISGKNVKVERFGAYGHSSGGTYILHTIKNGFFTAEDFRSYYNQKSEWLLPGESVSDPQNYGGPKALWAYFFVTEDGERFAAGALSP